MPQTKIRHVVIVTSSVKSLGLFVAEFNLVIAREFLPAVETSFSLSEQQVLAPLAFLRVDFFPESARMERVLDALDAAHKDGLRWSRFAARALVADTGITVV